MNIIPRAKLPFNFFNVVETASKGSLFFKASVINNVITSVSVWDLNLIPCNSKFFLISSEFSIIPLWTTETISEEWGWAFTILGTPWVAHLTCPIPKLPLDGDLNKFIHASLLSDI